MQSGVGESSTLELGFSISQALAGTQWELIFHEANTRDTTFIFFNAYLKYPRDMDHRMPAGILATPNKLEICIFYPNFQTEAEKITEVVRLISMK